jgi:hypothetical protein
MLGISDAVDLAGRISELVKAGVTLELKERVTELREAVINAKDETLQLREEVQRLKTLVAEQSNWAATAAAHPMEKTAGGAFVRRFAAAPGYYACPPLQDGQRFSGELDCPKCKALYPIKPAQQDHAVAIQSGLRTEW